MKHYIVFLAAFAALMAFLPAPEVFGQEKIIAGLKPGYSTLSASNQEELKKAVVGHSPETEMVRLVGLTDRLGWVNIARSEWNRADTVLAWHRIDAVANFYTARGWMVETIGFKTQTPFRGVSVEIVPREFSMRPTQAAASTAETVVLRDTCCCDSTKLASKLRNYMEFLVNQYVLGQKKNSTDSVEPPARPRLQFMAFYFQAAADKGVYNSGAYFTLKAENWLRASSGSTPRQVARLTMSPLIKIGSGYLKTGPSMNLFSKDAHFNTRMPDYTFGHLLGSVGLAVAVDYSRINLRLDWLGFSNNVEPGNDNQYFPWLSGIRNANLYPIELNFNLGKGYSFMAEGLAEGKQLTVPYFFTTINRNIASFPSIFGNATQLTAYCGYGEAMMSMSANDSHRSRGVILGIGIGF